MTKPRRSFLKYRIMKLIFCLITFLCVPVFSTEIKIDWATGSNTEQCRTGSSTTPCKTLDYALEKSLVNISQVTLLSGLQHLTSIASISRVNDVTISGKSNTIVECASVNNTTGIVIFEASNVTVKDIKFIGCGANHLDSNENSKGVIHFSSSDTVHLSGISFNDSTYMAVTLNNTDNVSIDQCNFTNSGGAGIFSEFVGVQKSLSRYSIKDCSFTNNGQKIGERADTAAFSNGGIYVTFNGTIRFKTFEIATCFFTGNKGVDHGGALTFYFSDNVSKNSVHVADVLFIENNATEGGAVKISFNSMNVVSNNISFDHVWFMRNSAQFGGGVVVKSIKTLDTNYMNFSYCLWHDNVATSAGAAITFYPIFFREDGQDFLSGRQLIPILDNSGFYRNDVNKTGIGIVYSDGFSINISGTVEFGNNNECPLYITSGHVHVLDNTVLKISQNTAVKGGGMALMHGSSVVAHANTRITFEGNTAREDGGAIYYNLKTYLDYFHLKHCFLRYFDPSVMPNKWQANFSFSSNHADGYGHDIYAASLLPCARVYNKSNPKDVFTTVPFDFKEDIEKLISTDPYKLVISSDNLPIYPGLMVTLPINTTDELSNNRTPILLATCAANETVDKCPFKSSKPFMYITEYKTTFLFDDYDQVGSTFPLRLTTLSTREIGISVNITVQQCPFGSTLVEGGSCQCITWKLPGFVSCNQVNGSAVMKVGYWSGCRTNNTTEILTGNCPYGYCDYGHVSDQDYYFAERNCDEFSNNDSLCAENRKGRLCGSCSENFSVHYHSGVYTCSECHYLNYGIVFYFLSELLPVTILFSVVVIFDISFTSGLMSSFIFFAQVLDIFETVASYNVPSVIRHLSMIYRVLFGFFNLDFFRLDSLSFCVFKTSNALDILVLKYITTLYAFFLICLFFLLMRCKLCHKLLKKCRRRSDDSYTAMNGLVAFVIVTYSQCAKVTFLILSKTTLHSIRSEHNIEVVRFAGHLEYFGPEHMQYAFPALIVMVYLILVPVVLILYPLYFSLKETLEIDVDEQCAKFKVSRLNLYFIPVMDAFQHAYKDIRDNKDMRVFAGLMFLCRLGVCISLAAPPNTLSSYSCLELILIFVLSVRTVCHPFKEDIHNTMESLMFANLAFIYGISLYCFVFESQFNVQMTIVVLSSVQFVLVTIPVMIAIYVIIIKLLVRFKYVKPGGPKATICRRFFLDPFMSDQEASVTDDDNSILPTRMIDEDIRSREQSMVGVISDEKSQVFDQRRRSYGGTHTTEKKLEPRNGGSY